MTLRVVEHGEATDPGRQRRGNEDSFFAAPPYFAVADGMGGAQAGEVASRIAMEHFERSMPPDGPPEQRLAEAVRAANEHIHELSRSDRERAGMGTTITAVHVGEDEVAVAHVGDSRAYRLRGGELEPLTRDHSLVQALIDQGRLSAEEAAHHPQRSIITRALGPEPDVEVDTRTYRAAEGDVFLICSDGLTSMVDDDTVGRIIASAPTLKAAAQSLVDAANAAGGRDNITVILFRLGGDGEPTVTDEDTARHAPVSAGDAGPAPVATKVPRPPPEPEPEGKSRRPRARRTIKGVLIAVAVLTPILVGAWVATRAVYFVGTDGKGLVTVFQGVPYELPAGIKLYQTYYRSGVPASVVPASRRHTITDHSLRSQRDATNFVDQLELGKIEG